ncbi:MAG TPA: aminopeptidase, partial [Polyangiales bacterium]|nr:aminopeptidase [Polyangiales bacterium]
LNNATLASVATYYDCVPGFEKMLRSVNGDLPRFYADVRALARLPQAQRDARVCPTQITKAANAANAKEAATLSARSWPDSD